MEVKNDEAGSGKESNLCPGKQRKTEGCGVLHSKLCLPLSFQVMIWWKTVHLQFRKEDWKVTEGHREGPNEPAQRHQPVITGASAASYQHLFYSARIRKTKGHKVPIHQQDRAIIMLMRCILFILPQKMGRGVMGHLKTELNSALACTATWNQAVQNNNKTVGFIVTEGLLHGWVVQH